VHHLFNHEVFAEKFRKVVENRFKRYGHFIYDTEAEIIRYKVSHTLLMPDSPLNILGNYVGARRTIEAIRR